MPALEARPELGPAEREIWNLYCRCSVDGSLRPADVQAVLDLSAINDPVDRHWLYEALVHFAGEASEILQRHEKSRREKAKHSR